MFVRCVLVRGRGGVGKASYVCLSVVSTVTDDLALHAHACVVWVQLAWSVSTGWHALTHLEKGVHLLLGPHLVAKDTVRPQIVWLMDVGARSYPEATDSLSATHDAAGALTFERRWLVDGASEGVLTLARICAADDLLRRFVSSCQVPWLVRLHLLLLWLLTEVRSGCVHCCILSSLIIF